MKLKGQVCVVTGAGKGIGRETAKLFYKEGASLALITRTAGDLSALKDELRCSDKRVFTFTGDVSCEATVVSFAQKLMKRFGKVDVLVNNAGMRFRKTFLDITTAEWQGVMNTNLNSAYFVSREIGQHMVAKKRGAVINIASIIGTLGLPDLSAYGASKGAVITFSKCLAVEWAKFNIRVNVVAPGFCETSYTENFKKNKKLYDFTIERTPQRRWGTSRDVAEACLFLATDSSKFITGEILHVDGGWSAW